MKTFWRSLAMAGVLAAGGLVLGGTPARAQAFGFSYASPGFGFGVGGGGVGVYGGGVPVVAPVAPVVAAPVVVAPGPFVVPRPVVVPRPFYGGYYHGGYRPYPRYYRR